MNYFIGIDSSTTATKTLLIDSHGQVVYVAASDYEFKTPFPLWSEQDPELWWEATKEGICKIISESGIDSKNIGGIGLTGQMHGLVLLDESGNVLRPAILWNDQRTGVQCEQIRIRVGKKNLINIAGNDALTGFTAPKILWVHDEEPEIFARVAHILLPKDYVRYKLTGELAIDRAGGAGTLLFNIKKRDWSPLILEQLDIKPEWLPPTYEGTQITGVVSQECATDTGLEPGTPVMAGGGDQAAAAVGTGAVEEGIVSLSLGTSGVVFASSNHPVIEPEARLHSFCHALPDMWHLMGVMLSAAGSLRWFRDTFTPGLEFESLLVPAEGVPAGSEGLIFLPYLTGERTPHPDPNARAAFIGLTVRHSLPYMTRAVLEGVSYGLRDSFELMKNAGLSKISQVRITGGGAKSTLWRQILADVLNTELVTVNSREGAAYGAAILAAVGAGEFEGVQSACNNFIEITGKTQPGHSVERYEEMYKLFRDLYPTLRSTFNSFSQLGF